jgi:hypothetical protein
MTSPQGHSEGQPRPLVSTLNQHLTCPLCRGYFVDATTIVDCLHSCEYFSKFQSLFLFFPRIDLSITVSAMC